MSDAPPNLLDAYTPFSSEEVQRLERYAKRVDRLAATPFMQATDVKFTFGIEVGKGATATVSGVTDEELEQALFLLRPLWLQEEKAGFMQVQAMVKSHAYLKGTDAGRLAIAHIKSHTAQLDRILGTPERVSLREQRVDQQGSVVSEEDVTPRRIFEDFLYGIYFHEEEERIARIGDSFHCEFPRFHFITTVQDVARTYRLFAVIVSGILAQPTLRA